MAAADGQMGPPHIGHLCTSWKRPCYSRQMPDRARWYEPNLTPTDVKRQHYVPLLVLRRFADSRGLLRVWDLDSGRDFASDPINAAVETGYYNVEAGPGATSIEGWLSGVEGAAAPVIERLVTDHETIEALSIPDQMALARFLAALLFRVPGFAKTMDEMMGSIAEQVNEMYRHVPGVEPYVPTPTTAKELASILEETQGYANLLWGMPWRLGRIPASTTLYTTDNPVGARLQRPVHPWWAEGPALRDFDYWIALAPDTLLKLEGYPHSPGAVSEWEKYERRRLDFSEWEVSVARHVATLGATRYLYGPGPIVPRDCAVRCIRRMSAANQAFARGYLGHDPNPPARGLPLRRQGAPARRARIGATS